MVRNTGVFSQILRLLPRQPMFERLVHETGSERRTKGFSSWDQCVAMLWCQIAGSKSLREIELGLKSAQGKLNHLGVSKAPSRSTLSYANANRPAELYERCFHELANRLGTKLRGRGLKKLRIKNPMLSVDGSVIDYLAEYLDKSGYKLVKGGMKLHLLLDHDGHFPAVASLTDVKSPERKFVRSLRLCRGSILIMDRGYFEHQLLSDLDEQGVFFVIRPHAAVRWQVLEEREIPKNGFVLADQIVVSRSEKAKRAGSKHLRLVTWWDAEHEREFKFLTNNVKLAASTIAKIYKARWQIESFFKDLKQLCKVKSFVGISSNAIKIQVWTALIAMLLLKFIRLMSQCGWSLSNLVAALRINLLLHRDLWAWLANPFPDSPGPPTTRQAQLNFATGLG